MLIALQMNHLSNANFEKKGGPIVASFLRDGYRVLMRSPVSVTLVHTRKGTTLTLRQTAEGIALYKNTRYVKTY